MPKANRTNIVSDKLHTRVANGKPIFPHAVSVEGSPLFPKLPDDLAAPDGVPSSVHEIAASF